MSASEPHDEQKPNEYQQDAKINRIPEDGQRVLQTYRGWKPEEILPHVLELVR